MDFVERIKTSERIADAIRTNYGRMRNMPSLIVKATVKGLPEFSMLKKDKDLLEMTEALLKETMSDNEIKEMKKKLGL